MEPPDTFKIFVLFDREYSKMNLFFCSTIMSLLTRNTVNVMASNSVIVCHIIGSPVAVFRWRERDIKVIVFNSFFQNDAGAFSKWVNLVRAFKSVRFDVKKKTDRLSEA